MVYKNICIQTHLYIYTCIFAVCMFAIFITLKFVCSLL